MSIPRCILLGFPGLLNDTKKLHCGNGNIVSMPYSKFNSECLSTNIFVLIALQKRADEINVRASDMWSFSILLWELTTREVPYSDLSPMEVGMKVMYCILT